MSTTSRRSSAASSSATPKRRRFTPKDEITLLKSLLPSAGPKPFPNDRFSQSQVTNKTRRLKLAYRKLARDKSLINTPHERSVYELGRQIWGELHEMIIINDEDDDDEVIDWSEYPYLMMEVSRTFPGEEELYKKGLEGLGKQILKGLDEKWKAVEMEMADVKRRQLQFCCKCFFKPGLF